MQSYIRSSPQVAWLLGQMGSAKLSSLAALPSSNRA